MAWLMLISGLMLISSSLILKYQYKNKLAKDMQQKDEPLLTISQENEVKEMAARLAEIRAINQEMDKLLQEIANKEQKIKQSLTALEGPAQNSFKDLLKEKAAATASSSKNLPAKYRQVLACWEKGLAREEIAQELKLGIRETDLILKLYQKEADSLAK